MSIQHHWNWKHWYWTFYHPGNKRITNIFHLGIRNIIFKKCLSRGYVASLEGNELDIESNEIEAEKRCSNSQWGTAKSHQKSRINLRATIAAFRIFKISIINTWPSLKQKIAPPKNRPPQKESRLPTSNHPFSGAILISGRVASYVGTAGMVGGYWSWTKSGKISLNTIGIWLIHYSLKLTAPWKMIVSKWNVPIENALCSGTSCLFQGSSTRNQAPNWN